MKKTAIPFLEDIDIQGKNITTDALIQREIGDDIVSKRPENMTRLRRFAISIIKYKGVRSVSQKLQRIILNVRVVFDSFRMTEKSYALTSAGQNKITLIFFSLVLDRLF